MCLFAFLFLVNRFSRFPDAGSAHPGENTSASPANAAESVQTDRSVSVEESPHFDVQPAPRSIDRGTTRPSNPAKADEKADTVGLSSAKPALDGNQPALIKQTSAEPSIGTVRVLGHRGCDVNTQGWFLSVGNPEQYDFKVSEDGETIEIHPVVPEPTGNFEFVHCADPGPLAGKRIRFSARIKAKGVTKTANLRLRGENSNRQRIAYSEQKVGNSHDWSEFTADLDVGNEVALLSYGLTFRSPGRIWMSHPELSIIR